MVFTLFGLIETPLTMLAVFLAFISSLFICMPAHEFAHAHAAVRDGDNNVITSTYATIQTVNTKQDIITGAKNRLATYCNALYLPK